MKEAIKTILMLVVVLFSLTITFISYERIENLYNNNHQNALSYDIGEMVSAFIIVIITGLLAYAIIIGLRRFAIYLLGEEE